MANFDKGLGKMDIERRKEFYRDVVENVHDITTAQAMADKWGLNLGAVKSSLANLKRKGVVVPFKTYRASYLNEDFLKELREIVEARQEKSE